MIVPGLGDPDFLRLGLRDFGPLRFEEILLRGLCDILLPRFKDILLGDIHLLDLGEDLPLLLGL